jgi:peptidoglycan/LPS O-acetylase OafA/YrhL
MTGNDPLHSRLKGLEFLRAACALVVLLNHVYCEGADVPQFTPIVAIAAYSVEAVMGFFVLSGCVIALQDYERPGPYFRARLLRILPIYYVVLAISLAAMLACGAHFGFWQLIGNLFFLQTLDWSPLNPLRFFIPSWSLSYELYYYAAFIMIMLVPRLLMPLLLGSIAVGVALYFTPLPAPAMWLLHAFSFFAMWLGGVLITRLVRAGYTVSLGTGAFMFALGLSFAHLPLSQPEKFDFERLFDFSLCFSFLVWALLSEGLRDSTTAVSRWQLDLGLPARIALAIVVLALLWAFSPVHLANKLALTFVATALALAPGPMVWLAGRVAKPATPFMLYVAGLSYALYLVHYPLVQTFNVLQPFPPVVDLIVVVALSFAFAHLLDYVFQPWVRRRLLPRPPSTTMPASTASKSSPRT